MKTGLIVLLVIAGVLLAFAVGGFLENRFGWCKPNLNIGGA